MISPSKNISGLARPEPAPQYHLAQESEHFLTSLTDKVNHLAAYTGSIPHEVYEQDVARTKRFITHMLATDYQIATNIKLSKPDRAHFHDLHKTLGDLSKTWPSQKPRNPERHPLAAYFWQYVHVPCTALSLCTEILIAMVYRFVKYTTSQGTYKSCIFGLARNEGLDVLAQKLYIDRVCLFYIIAAGNKTLWTNFTTAANQVVGLYFDRIARPAQGQRGIEHLWSVTQRLDVLLNRRGELYIERKFDARGSRQAKLALWYQEKQDAYRLKRMQVVDSKPSMMMKRRATVEVLAMKA